MTERRSNEELFSQPNSSGEGDEFHQTVLELVRTACRYPKGSLQRQRCLTQIIGLVSTSNLLWKDSISGYEDALQQTWLYFVLNLCEAATSQQPYNPQQSLLTTWLNAYLKRRLQDIKINLQHQRSNQVLISEETFDPIEQLPAPPEIPAIVQQVQQWAEADADGELRRTHIRGRKDVNCQVLILRRLPPESGWKELSQEFGLGISTLSAFYERQCRPRLRKFGEQAGYF